MLPPELRCLENTVCFVSAGSADVFTRGQHLTAIKGAHIFSDMWCSISRDKQRSIFIIKQAWRKHSALQDSLTTLSRNTDLIIFLQIWSKSKIINFVFHPDNLEFCRSFFLFLEMGIWWLRTLWLWDKKRTFDRGKKGSLNYIWRFFFLQINAVSKSTEGRNLLFNNLWMNPLHHVFMTFYGVS